MIIIHTSGYGILGVLIYCGMHAFHSVICGPLCIVIALALLDKMALPLKIVMQSHTINLLLCNCMS